MKTADLLRLIRSMSKAEKRNFKVYASRHTVTADLTYVKLFDLLEQGVEEDAALISKIPGKVSKSGFVNLKNYLYRSLMDSLTAFNKGNLFSLEIYSLVMDYQLLRFKGLPDLAENTAEEVMHKAQALSRYGTISDLLIDLSLVNFTRLEMNPGLGRESLKSLAAQEAIYLKNLNLLSKFRQVCDERFDMIFDPDLAISPDSKARLANLINKFLKDIDEKDILYGNYRFITYFEITNQIIITGNFQTDRISKLIQRGKLIKTHKGNMRPAVMADSRVFELHNIFKNFTEKDFSTLLNIYNDPQLSGVYVGAVQYFIIWLASIHALEKCYFGAFIDFVTKISGGDIHKIVQSKTALVKYALFRGTGISYMFLGNFHQADVCFQGMMHFKSMYQSATFGVLYTYHIICNIELGNRQLVRNMLRSYKIYVNKGKIIGEDFDIMYKVMNVINQHNGLLDIKEAIAPYLQIIQNSETFRIREDGLYFSAYVLSKYYNESLADSLRKRMPGFLKELKPAKA